MSDHRPNLDEALQKKFITTLTYAERVYPQIRVNPYLPTIRKSQKLKNCFTKVVSYDPSKHLWPFIFINSTKKISSFLAEKIPIFELFLLIFHFYRSRIVQMSWFLVYYHFSTRGTRIRQKLNDLKNQIQKFFFIWAVFLPKKIFSGFAQKILIFTNSDSPYQKTAVYQISVHLEAYWVMKLNFDVRC